MEDVGVVSLVGVEGDGRRNPMLVHGGKPAEQKLEEGKQLLPGILDEVTIDLITTKLSWTAFCILSSVSGSWHGAIQSHQVYDARVRAKSTQTLVAMEDRPFGYPSRIALCSIEEGSFYYLPTIPAVHQGIPDSCGYVFLDGKLYVLGGDKDSPVSIDKGCTEVYEWDLAAGQRQWKQCASMQEPRTQFGSSVKDGKIYVFAGSCLMQPVLGSEVYDPMEDAWSSITPVPSLRFNHKVTVVGEELFLHNGQVYRYDDDYNDDNDPFSDHIEDALFAEVYHPVKDEWRNLEDFTKDREDVVMMVGGKVYKLNRLGIKVYDMPADSWISLHPLPFAALESSLFTKIVPTAALGVDGEVLVLARQTTIGFYRDGSSLIRSKGLGAENKGIVWQKLHCPLSIGGAFGTDSFMCSIQL